MQHAQAAEKASAIRWSIVTVSYNSAEPLQRYWNTPRPDGVEWIVVDNDSRDDSLKVAARLGATTISLGANHGFSAANNQGFRRARGKFVAFVNPDVAIDFSTLDRLESSLNAHGGIVAPQLRSNDGSLQPNGRGAPSLFNKVLSRLGVPAVRRKYYRYAAPGEEIVVDWVMGAATVARRDDLAQLKSDGPWDARYFVYYEDADFGLRSWRSGRTVRVVGDVVWVHGWARATKSINWRAWLLEVSSMRTFYSRYPALILTSGRGPWPSSTSNQISAKASEA